MGFDNDNDNDYSKNQQYQMITLLQNLHYCVNFERVTFDCSKLLLVQKCNRFLFLFEISDIDFNENLNKNSI